MPRFKTKRREEATFAFFNVGYIPQIIPIDNVIKCAQFLGRYLVSNIYFLFFRSNASSAIRPSSCADVFFSI